MKVLGISGSPRPGGATERLVRSVLDGVEECETELISLAGRQIGGCIACMGCVADNTCRVLDDMWRLRALVVEADAYVIGAANYYGTLNALAHCFLERWYQFCHGNCGAVAGKIAIAVSVGAVETEAPARAIQRLFRYHRVECIGSISAKGAVASFSSGCGENGTECAVHPARRVATKRVEQTIPDLSKQPGICEEAHRLGRQLSMRLLEREETPGEEK